MVYTDVPALVFLSALLLINIGMILIWPLSVPFTSLLIPMFLGSIWLGPRYLPWFVIGCLACVVLSVPVQRQITVRTSVAILVLFLFGLIVLLSSFRRSRLGVAGPRGESMLVDLRDRLSSQSKIPPLPSDWYAEGVLRSAGGTQFAGDFLVASRNAYDDSLDVVVVDVSGKGVGAGTRSLLLSGAFGGLISAITPQDFLTAANTYLLRQNWGEGFATAIHLHLDLKTGDFQLRKAGHPPAIWLHAGSGTWSVLDSDGPALGLIEGLDFDVVRGRLQPGDGLVLYTDGLVEDPQRDISSGIDKLAGAAARLLKTGFEGGERELVEKIGRADDDRALLLVHRRWPSAMAHRHG